jgi:hypothetical protein
VGVILQNETARPADHVQPHELAPILGLITFFERRERPDRTLVSPHKLGFTANGSDHCFGTNTDVLIVFDK